MAKPSVGDLVRHPGPVRDILRDIVLSIPDFGLRALDVPEVIKLTRPQNMGTAADYLVRIFVEHLNGGIAAPSKDGRWIADYGIRKALEIAPSLVDCMRDVVAGARVRAEGAIRSGEIDEQVQADAFRLSFIDSVMRARGAAFRNGVPSVAEYLQTIEPTPVELGELQRVTDGLRDADWLVAAHRCLLNPTLGNSVVNGDADLVIDDMLIDLKTTQTFAVKRDHVEALLCYAALLRDQEGRWPQILAVQFTRQSALAWIPIDAFDTEKLDRLYFAVRDP